MIRDLILPAIIAAGALAMPIFVNADEFPAHSYVAQSESTESLENLEKWNARLRCHNFYTIESRSQCFVIAAKRSENEIYKLAKFKP